MCVCVSVECFPLSIQVSGAELEEMDGMYMYNTVTFTHTSTLMHTHTHTHTHSPASSQEQVQSMQRTIEDYEQQVMIM